jgi:hypothetical protein
MLSRCNAWTNEWHKEEEINKWKNKQQRKEAGALSAALLALIAADAAEDKPPPIPRTHVNPNRSKRTLLALTCERARTLWIIGRQQATRPTCRLSYPNSNGEKTILKRRQNGLSCPSHMVSSAALRDKTG